MSKIWSKTENKILMILLLFSISIGLWNNFRQLWMQDNGLDPTQISRILSYGTLFCVVGILIFSKYIKLNKIKSFITYKKSRFLFQILYLNAAYYLTYLKQINKETEVAEYILKNSIRNKELLKMLSLKKSLVYFTTSLKSNELVMEKTMRGKIIKLYEEDEDILEDAITENRQAIEMAKIYSDILNSAMDAYGSIISNNLNGVMKTLTSITIVLAVPTMISSFWGMNVDLPFEHNSFGFAIMISIALITTLIVTWWLKKKDMLN